jgi:hypothetical protein
MDQGAFYGVVSAVNFTLLGLWWVAVKDRVDPSGADTAFRRMSYAMSLQFAIPATASLLAQVAPQEPTIWRFSFGLAGLAGVVGMTLLGRQLRRSSELVPRLVGPVGAVLYALMVVQAVLPDAAPGDLRPIEVEGLLVSLIVFVGVQAAWFVHMSPVRD